MSCFVSLSDESQTPICCCERLILTSDPSDAVILAARIRPPLMPCVCVRVCVCVCVCVCVSLLSDCVQVKFYNYSNYIIAVIKVAERFQ